MKSLFYKTNYYQAPAQDNTGAWTSLVWVQEDELRGVFVALQLILGFALASLPIWIVIGYSIAMSS